MKRLDNYVNMLKGGVITDFKIGQNVTVNGKSSYIIGFISNKTGTQYNNAALLKEDKKTFDGIYAQNFINEGDGTQLTQAEIDAGRETLKNSLQKNPSNVKFLQQPGELNTPGNDEVAETPEAKAARVEAARVEAARVEAARVEAARVEAARVEAARVEAARVEEAQRRAAPAAAPTPAAPPAAAPPGSYISNVPQNREIDKDLVVLSVKLNPAPAAPVPSGSPVVAAPSFYDSGPSEPTYFRVTVYKTINGKDTYVNSRPAYPSDTVKKILDAFKVSGKICVVSSGKQFVKSLNGEKDLYTTLGQLHLKYESVELYVL